MADLARAGLTIAGGVLFGPLGALAGGVLGSVLFPTRLPDVKGPRIKELTFQNSTVGSALPIVYGTRKLAGKINWWSDLIEETNTDEVGGGKGGGGQEVTEYAYFVDVSIIICDGEDGRPSKPQGIRRIWAYGDLIYDLTPQRDDETDTAYNERIATSQQTAELMTIWPGDEDQGPSPLIESWKGAGNVPSYRGVYRVEFERFPLGKYGNAIPQFTFEVFTDGTSDEVECSQYSAGHLEPWVEGGRDPRNLLNTHVYTVSTIDYDDFTDAAAALEAAAGRSLFTSDEYLHAWQKTSGASLQSPCDGITSSDNVSLYLLYNVVATTDRRCDGFPGATGTNSCDKAYNTVGVGHVFWQPGSQHGLYVVVANAETEEQYFNGYSGSGSVSCADSAHYVTDIGDARLQVTRTTQPPSGCEGGVPLANAPGYCLVDGEVVRALTWTQVSGTFKVLQRYTDNGVVVTKYPVNPCLPSTDPNYSNQAWWEAAYAQALADGEPIDPGLTYGVDYPTVVSTVWQASCETQAVDVACINVGSIIEDILDRAGFPHVVDVDDVTSCLYGYTCNTRPDEDVGSALEPLRMYGFLDVVETVDGDSPALSFRPRGGSSVQTYTVNDLRVRADRSEAPPSVKVQRTQEKDLPRRLAVAYEDIDRDHEPDSRDATRIVGEAEKDVTVSLPISMTATQAKQLADIYLREFYDSRNVYEFTLSNRELEREPADVVTIPSTIEDQNETVRIVDISYALGGVLSVTALGYDSEAYTSTATADPGEGGGSNGGASGNVVCPSEMVLLDACIRDQDTTDAGYFAAVYGLCDTWQCGTIYRSVDGGTTWGRVAQATRQATVAEITDISGYDTGSSGVDTSAPDYDADNTITLDMLTIGGTLSSVTDALILGGYNAAAIGDDGRWQIIQFKTADRQSDGSWIISDILWGLRGTEEHQNTTVAGDKFVLLDSSLVRIAETAGTIGIERQLKVASCGENPDAVTTVYDFTTQGLCYVPDLVSPEPPADDTSDINVGCSTILIWNPSAQRYEPGPLRIADACDLLNDTSSYSIGDHIAVVDNDSSGPVFGIVPDAGGGLSDGDKGDITVSGSGSVWTIDNDAVTFAKIQDIATSRILGRTTALSGSIEELTVGPGLVLSSGSLSAAPVDASDVSYGNTSSGLSATDVQEAIDELEALFSAGNPTSGLPAVAHQAANLSRTNNTPTDTDLTFVLAAGTYTFEARFIVTAHATPDAQLNLEYSGSVTDVDITRFANAVGSGPAALRTTSLPLNMTFTVTDTFFQNHSGSIEVSTGGTLKMTFHQITTSGANPVIFHRGSWMRVQRVT